MARPHVREFLDSFLRPLVAGGEFAQMLSSGRAAALGLFHRLSAGPRFETPIAPEHDIFIQLMKLKNTLRWMRGEDLITHLGLEYYD